MLQRARITGSLHTPLFKPFTCIYCKDRAKLITRRKNFIKVSTSVK